MAPNWRGVIKPAIETGQMLATRGLRGVRRRHVRRGQRAGRHREPDGVPAAVHVGRAGHAPAHRGALDTLTREADRRAIGDITRRAAIGFCFGGLNVLDLARTGADVQAVVSMHGTLSTPQPAKTGDIKAAVLAVHGAADPIAPKAERDAFEAEMDAGRRALGAA